MSKRGSDHPCTTPVIGTGIGELANEASVFDHVHLQWHSDSAETQETTPDTTEQSTETQETQETTETKPNKWQDLLPTEYRGNEALEGMTGPGDLVKSFIDARTNLEGTIKLPSENASDEDIAAFRKAMNVPDSAEGYSLNTKVPDNMKELETWFKETAHANHLNNEQANAFFSKFMSNYDEGVNALVAGRQKEKEATETALKEEWGDNYKANLAQTYSAIQKLAGKEFLDSLEESGIGNDIRVLRGFWRWSNTVSDDKLVGGDGTALGEKKKGFQFKNTPGMN
jgi:hypothetical protein